MPRFPADPRTRQRLIALVLFSVLGGCGGYQKSEPQAAPAAEQAPGSPSGAGMDEDQAAEPATLEEAEAQLKRAEAELQNALGPMAFAEPPAATAGAQPAPAPAQAPPAAEASAPRDAERAEAEKKSEASSNCDLACRAFSSLSRAAQAVCRLDGDGGERCSRARKVVADAEARVSSCSCARP
ncbi:MAG TPA: hypothetical protein VM686_29810 [Polyangiaceae bacterium]|nr:hypothetical protein [Polyangiaceae bacterium]